MKLGTNYRMVRKFAENKNHNLSLNFDRIRPFEVFSLKIVSTVSFSKTIKDVDLCFTSRKPFKMYS